MVIPKKDLVHGAYYYGTCRNATIARWHAERNKFYYLRHKFGCTFIEDIRHPEDDDGFDLFNPLDYLGVATEVENTIEFPKE